MNNKIYELELNEKDTQQFISLSRKSENVEIFTEEEKELFSELVIQLSSQH